MTPTQTPFDHLDIYPLSLTNEAGLTYALMKTKSGPQLAVWAEAADLTGFKGETSALAGKILLMGPCDPQNAAVLRSRLDWLNPSLLGLRTSAGMGDRIGLATPGHIRAVRATGEKVAPIFAQQSMREMTRTNRSPRQVMDDALWGIFQEGWRGGFGADADHLKTTEDIDTCLQAGFTFFTIDPGAYVDDRSMELSTSELGEVAASLPRDIQPAATGLIGKHFSFKGLQIHFDTTTLLRAVVKYGRAIAHVAAMYRHLVNAAGECPFELEVSVDETNQPTSHAEHLYITHELSRQGVKWISLAPRYVGRFEKGVEYIGNREAFDSDLRGHAAIARQFGPYKLSLHSGSDKFSIYPAFMHRTQGQAHLKTAGTSYLEALRTLAMGDVDLFREIYAFARQNYEVDKASYHVSASLERAPKVEMVEDWPGLLDQFDAREILHVSFGSVLTSTLDTGAFCFRDRLIDFLKNHPEAYSTNLENHFTRHLAPFSLKY